MNHFSPRLRAVRQSCAILTLLGAASLCAGAWAQAPLVLPESINQLVERYPEEKIATSAEADTALEQVKAERAEVDTRFSSAEQLCYTKFFSTRCVETAKDERRESLVLLRRIEVQANSVKRRLRAEQRDAVLARQREAELASAPQREKNEAASRAAASKKADARAARLVSEDAAAVKQAKRDEAALAKRGIQPGTPAASAALATDLRAQDHLDRQAKANAKEAANADKRAASIKSFEAKGVAAQARQDKVAEKKAAKEEARQARAARVKAEADAKAKARADAEAAKAGS